PYTFSRYAGPTSNCKLTPSFVGKHKSSRTEDVSFDMHCAPRKIEVIFIVGIELIRASIVRRPRSKLFKESHLSVDVKCGHQRNGNTSNQKLIPASIVACLEAPLLQWRPCPSVI